MADPSTNANQEQVLVTGSKKRLYAKLHSELNKLSKNISKFEDNVMVTAEQIPSFRKMGNLHSAIFMSVNGVLGEEELSDKKSP